MGRKLPHFDRNLVKILAIFVVINSIRITLSKPSGPERLLGGKRMEVGESSRHAGGLHQRLAKLMTALSFKFWMTFFLVWMAWIRTDLLAELIPEKSLSQNKNHAYQQCEEIIRNSDSSQVARGAVSKKDGQLLRSGPKEKGTAHREPEFRRNIDSQVTKRRKITTLSSDIPEQVELIKKDYQNLKYSLMMYKKRLVKIYTPTNSRSAYDSLKGILAELYRLVCIWSGGKDFQKLVGTSFFDLSHDLQKKIVFHFFQTKLETFKDLLVNRRLKGGFLEDKYSHALEVQIFRTISFLVKHELLEEEVTEKWINEKPILSVIEHHINAMSSPRYFLPHKLEDIISKSQSGEHLHLLLKLIHKKSWKHIDYQYVKSRVLGFAMINGTPEERIVSLKTNFLLARFDETEATVRNKKEIVSRELVDFLESIEFSSISQVEFIAQSHLLYDMIHFVIQYHSDLFYKSFKEKRRAEEFSKKMEVIELARVWLQGAREVEFFSKVGLWTSEIDASKSKNLISLEEAQNWSWLTRAPDGSFEKKFGLFCPKDQFTWNKILLNAAIKRGFGGEDNVVNVGSYLAFWNQGETKYFGTNFLFNPYLKRRSRKAEVSLVEERRISSLFLKGAYEWMDKLKFIYLKLQKNKKYCLDKIKEISLDSNDLISKDLNNWLKSSATLQLINHRISEHCLKAQRSWDRFEDKLHLLNLELLRIEKYSNSWKNREPYSRFPKSSTKKRITRNSLKASSQDSSVQLSKFQAQKGFQIPWLQFTHQTPYY